MGDFASFDLIRFYIRVPRFVYSQSVRLGRRPGHALEYQNVAPGYEIRALRYVAPERETRNALIRIFKFRDARAGLYAFDEFLVEHADGFECAFAPSCGRVAGGLMKPRSEVRLVGKITQ